MKTSGRHWTGAKRTTKWMKDKIAAKQKAQWQAKKERLSERQRLLRSGNPINEAVTNER